MSDALDADIHGGPAQSSAEGKRRHAMPVFIAAGCVLALLLAVMPGILTRMQIRRDIRESARPGWAAVDVNTPNPNLLSTAISKVERGLRWSWDSGYIPLTFKQPNFSGVLNSDVMVALSCPTTDVRALVHPLTDSAALARALRRAKDLQTLDLSLSQGRTVSSVSEVIDILPEFEKLSSFSVTLYEPSLDEASIAALEQIPSLRRVTLKMSPLPDEAVVERIARNPAVEVLIVTTRSAPYADLKIRMAKDRPGLRIVQRPY